MIQSPLTKKNNVKKVGSIATAKIVSSYENMFELDVSSFFENLKNIDIYECEETGYQFYHPLNICGDGNFYEHLQQYEWYYMPWKWEHEVAYEKLKKKDKILEVGSGGNGFIERLHHEGFDITGLELNQESIKDAQEKGLKVHNEMIDEHAQKNSEVYDVVCSYQVLEHIADVRSFIQSSLDCLKVGGKLIICVPNNNSFLKDSFNILNMPPHHMGLWNKESLMSLEKVFSIKLEETLFQPLQEYHETYFLQTAFRRYMPNPLASRLGKIAPASIAKAWSEEYKGFSIQVHFKKI